MPGAEWFPGARLNYADRLVAGVADELAGVDPDRLVADRDAVLRALLAAKAGTDLP